MAMSGGNAALGTGLAGYIKDRMQDAFGDSYQLVVRDADNNIISEAPALSTNAFADAIVDYIKEVGRVHVTIGDTTYIGTIV